MNLSTLAAVIAMLMTPGGHATLHRDGTLYAETGTRNGTSSALIVRTRMRGLLIRVYEDGTIRMRVGTRGRVIIGCLPVKGCE